MKNQYRGGNCLKGGEGGAWIVCRFKGEGGGGAWQVGGGWCF